MEPSQGISARPADRASRGDRNASFLDAWSLVHLMTGVALGWTVEPFVALVVMVLWEPLEIFVLSPLLWRLGRIRFGHESLRNALSDIVWDAAGVSFGAFVLRRLAEPPFILFD